MTHCKIQDHTIDHYDSLLSSASFVSSKSITQPYAKRSAKHSRQIPLVGGDKPAKRAFIINSLVPTKEFCLMVQALNLVYLVLCLKPFTDESNVDITSAKLHASHDDTEDRRTAFIVSIPCSAIQPLLSSPLKSSPPKWHRYPKHG